MTESTEYTKFKVTFVDACTKAREGIVRCRLEGSLGGDVWVEVTEQELGRSIEQEEQ